MSRSLHGLGVSTGRAVGEVRRMPDPPSEPEAGRLDQQQRPAEASRLRAAAEAVADRLRERAALLADAEAGQVLEATAMMAADPTLLDSAAAEVHAGQPAERACWVAAGTVAEALHGAGGYLAQRAADVLDVRDRIIAELRGEPPPGIPQQEQPFVLLARDLAPADTATLDPTKVVAILTAGGGPSSHTAILARSMALPAVVAADGVLALTDGSTVLVDGGTGEVVLDPQEPVTDAPPARAVRLAGPGLTADGVRVPLLANIGSPADVEAALAAGAEGVGLFRTEFCFLDRETAPDAEEQRQAYRHVFAAFPQAPVTVRVLDAGADKPLPFLPGEPEANPALGVRGIRRLPEALLDEQLTAIARAAAGTDAQPRVMAPMVGTAEEARAFTRRARAAGLGRAGIMIEVPSVALAAETVLRCCDFASIGSNDLAQYTFAADRELAALARLGDPWQPALLRLIQLAAEPAQSLGVPLGLCGEAAADPALAPVLVGLGVGSLSMSAAALPEVGRALGEVSISQCRRAARAALRAEDAATAREAATTALRERP